MLCIFGKTKEAGNTFAFCINFRLSVVFGCIIPPPTSPLFFIHSDTFILIHRHRSISVAASPLVDFRFKFCSWTV